jgi:cell volume regulation protein A
MNDPMAVYLTLTMIAFALAAVSPGASAARDAAFMLLMQFGLGALAGVAGGLLISRTLQWIRAADPGITALLLASFGLLVFAATGWAGGSGFLAVYLLGMVLASRAAGRLDAHRVEAALVAMDAYAWLAQAGMFLLLGLLVNPSELVPIALPAVGVAAVLMLVARPLAVWLCLLPFRFRRNEVIFISWVGLRGAVPIVLAVFPLMARVPQAKLLFNVAFVVVLMSLVLQGATIGVFARWLRVALPDPSDERRSRQLYGDFVLDASTKLSAVCEFYGLPMPKGSDEEIRTWMARALRRTPIVGDEIRLGDATLVIRAMKGSTITVVGLKLGAAA